MAFKLCIVISATTFGEVNLNALISCLLYSLLLYGPYAPTQISTVNLSNQ